MVRGEIALLQLPEDDLIVDLEVAAILEEPGLEADLGLEGILIEGVIVIVGVGLGQEAIEEIQGPDLDQEQEIAAGLSLGKNLVQKGDQNQTIGDQEVETEQGMVDQEVAVEQNVLDL